MASLHHHHYLALDEHHSTAPLDVTVASSTHTHSDASSPPSPTTIAAATTLATLAGSGIHAPSSHPEYEAGNEDDEDDEDDDYGGGISIASADTHMAEEDVAEQLQSVMDQLQAFPHTLTHPFDPFEPIPSFQVPSIHMPIPHIYSGHMSSSDPSLEPPPTLQEAHLSIQDRASFLPITSFFHIIAPERPTVPGLDLIQVPDSITRDHLQGDSCDFQGIDWALRNTARSHIRARRFECEESKLPPSLQAVRKRVRDIPSTDNFFQFKRNNTTHRAFFPHFQLRNVLAATSRNDIYYAAGQQVYRTDAAGSPAVEMINLSKRLTVDGSITTIASTDNVLIAGAFDGEYAIADLSSTYGSPCTFGRTTDFTSNTKSRIVNHMHLFESRTTYQPQAVFCSNDFRLRILDCATDRFTNSFLYAAAVNCSATSPNGRMRVVVGDFQETLITNAQTGQPFETLKSHTDDAFACAWADDGIHVATAAQDSTIVVWDARTWRTPLTTLKSELSVPRSLRFSPVGSGPRVLIAAEADDYIDIINAQTFESKQVFDFFGPIGGVTFTPDGQSLFIANGERRFGGIIEVDRTGWPGATPRRRDKKKQNWDDFATDWDFDDQLSNHDRAIAGHVERERRCLNLGDVIV